MPDNQVGDEVGEAAQSAVAAAAIGSDESPFRIGLKDIIAGSARGVAQVFVGHPLDTVKVRMQNGGFSSISQCLAQTARHEGLYGFYKGATSPLAGVVAYSATLFLAYGQSRYWVSRLWGQSPDTADGQLSIAQLLVAGAVTGMFAGLVESPIDLLKAKLQMQYSHSGGTSSGKPTQYRGTFDCARTLLRSEGGLRNLYQGFDATLTRNLFGSAIYFASYDLLRRQLSVHLSEGELRAQHVVTAGGLAGLAFWTSIYPFDTIKSRMQTEATERSLRRYPNVLAALRIIVREEGARALW
eukprot:CAMPEP_0177678090 /NCGR_PEP_ID=MMETSP0447-20121125/28813_1 /TAXON_ID=0 /ORGANISM="Stygamoeba regulata, Strain BSH-02190019" /LENGTH=297 /DNA_ID=CAMNT_0019187049 /DNA_START=71 /DNA_END=961 /DNA_ORIENTATION=+